MSPNNTNPGHIDLAGTISRFRIPLRPLQGFERIDAENGNFTVSELNPTPEETRERVFRTIKGFRIYNVKVWAGM
ncbi:MAG: hypothetical protein GYA41_02495 [Bacteroidales bacterium]|nr:hypothetical protein [Bacteroidales bacterium]